MAGWIGLGRAILGASFLFACTSVGVSADAPPAPHHALGTKVWLSAANAACTDRTQPGPPSALTFVWSGQCENNLLEGAGTLTVFAHGPLALTFTGMFAHGVAEGQEVIAYANGFQFDGEFHDNEPNGHGSLRNAHGDVTKGDYKNDMLEGQALTLESDGSKVTLTYKDDVLDGPFTVEIPHSYRQEGTMRSGHAEGSLVTSFADGSRLEEEFTNGIVGTQGAYVDPRGDRIAGAFSIAKVDPTRPHSLDYPELSRRLDEQGTVIVNVTVLANGRVADARVRQSSGAERLDTAARDAVATWSYLPATVDGHPVPSVRVVTIPFVLTGGEAQPAGN